MFQNDKIARQKADAARKIAIQAGGRRRADAVAERVYQATKADLDKWTRENVGLD